MAKKKRTRQAPSSTPWDKLDSESLNPAEALVQATHKSAYAFRHEPFDGDIEFFNRFSRDLCPWCGSQNINRRGYERSGMQRYLCRECKKTFSPATGTIFEDRKLPLSAWADFLMQLFSFESINVMTREDRRSDTTIPYWIGKIFIVLDGIQDNRELSGRVQIDEAYYPVPTKEAVAVEGKLLRGLSRNKICIGIGCDDSGNALFAQAGFGKLSAGRAMKAYGAHIKRSSLLIHDMEKAHRRLVEELELKEEVYNSKLISKLDDADNPLGDVNRLCYLVKRFLDSHSGFKRNDLEGYLNLLSVMMNQPGDKMEKVAFVLNHAMANPKTLRFRDFYNVKSSSEG